MFTVLGFIATALYILAIADIILSNRSLVGKIILIVLVLMFPFLGSIVYLLAFRKK